MNYVLQNKIALKHATEIREIESMASGCGNHGLLDGILGLISMKYYFTGNLLSQMVSKQQELAQTNGQGRSTGKEYAVQINQCQQLLGNTGTWIYEKFLRKMMAAHDESIITIKQVVQNKSSSDVITKMRR